MDKKLAIGAINKWLIDIFMRKINIKKSLNDESVYVMINHSDKILEKLWEVTLVWLISRDIFLKF